MNNETKTAEEIASEFFSKNGKVFDDCFKKNIVEFNGNKCGDCNCADVEASKKGDEIKQFPCLGLIKDIKDIECNKNVGNIEDKLNSFKKFLK